ncbi:hypothetical protein NA56DRAFT_497849 [Hyaloscypha hepaticicola]|uniref:Extracellular membrane protein CFEM domain-containing protein n=1 Tax=Hyaloscypha hepaticicola TaxID=2082293 RepID=A0A2J6QEP4_9HELO|nr:hypothetical protein NA56DRAFT_497849 [Hyaloscypha hepaticicola]
MGPSACLASILILYSLRRVMPFTSTSAPTVSSILVIQHPASSIQHPASSIQHPASSIQHPTPTSIQRWAPTIHAPALVLALALARTTRDQNSERGRPQTALRGGVAWRGVVSCCLQPLHANKGCVCPVTKYLLQRCVCDWLRALRKSRLRVCSRADDSLPRRSTSKSNVESNSAHWAACSSHDQNLHRDYGTLLNNATPSVAVDSPVHAVGGRVDQYSTAPPRRMITELQPSLLTLVRLPFQFFSDA